ncbi:MAG: PEP-CTERM sorting domain-containing protein [Phycisphaerales bacterium]|nr:PEP-CTERM sorting domain-containing protein [Phycisphaerales bacterium]
MKKCLLAGTVALVATAGVASANSLTTLFTSNNGGNEGWGVFFDVDIVNPDGLIFDQVDINARGSTGVSIGVEVYIIAGSSDFGNVNGPTNSSAGWTLVGTGSGISEASDVPTPVVLNSSFTLLPGLYGMGIRTTGLGQNYTNGTGANQFFANSDLELSLGNARNDASGFGGSSFFPRVWNGTLHYEVVPAPGTAALLGLGGLVGLRRRR